MDSNKTSDIMDPTKTKVRIGRAYEAAFRSICTLVGNGCIDRNIIQSCENNRIVTAQYEFEYDERLETIATKDKIGMLRDGATWFKGVRENQNENAMGMWLNLLELVSAEYHKKYSCVEYIKTDLAFPADTLGMFKTRIRQVVCALGYAVSDVQLAPRQDSMEDVYALSLRVELFIGAGEPKPLLCKLYFRHKNGVFSPIHAEEALSMDTSIADVVSHGTDGSHNTDSEHSMIVDDVLHMLSRFIKGEMELGFTDCMIITNETDRQNFERFLRNELDEEVFLRNDMGDEISFECRKLKVLGVSHTQWLDPAFHVYVDGQKAFLAKIHADNTLSMFCCCDDLNNRLIDRNTIPYHSEETGETERIFLDIAEPDLGLSADQLDIIRTSSAFSEHFVPISCDETKRRGIECARYLCKPSALQFVVNGKTCYKCADCPYPEVVYYDPTGKPLYTPLLHFDAETLTVVHKDTLSCALCGRTYSGENMDENAFYCNFCSSAIESAKAKSVSADRRNAYRAYSAMLPLTLRISNVFGKKMCFENEDRLIFFVGKKNFFFDKLNLTDSGKIKAPEKREFK